MPQISFQCSHISNCGERGLFYLPFPLHLVHVSDEWLYGELAGKKPHHSQLWQKDSI